MNQRPQLRSRKNLPPYGLTGLFLFLLSFSAFSQNRYTVSGFFSDAKSGERIIGANIYEKNSRLGASANEYGFYSLTLPEGNCVFSVSFIGYASQDIIFELKSDTTMNMALSAEAVEFQEVVVTAERSKVDDSQMSVTDVPIQKLTKIPVIMGEPDVLKVIQLMPGVQSGTEGTSGIYVRGGAADQNLFLLDGVPVYNASHLFGFFSVFNPGAIKSVKLYKGGFPARYGGRLSSVVDIRMKEGNDKEFKGEVSVGLIASRINLEGPVNDGKTSFLISARRTYIDVLVQPAIYFYNKMNDYDQVTGGYFFQDFNAKINHKFSDKSRLYLSAYTGKDKIYMKSKYEYYNESYYYDEEGNIHQDASANYNDRSEMNMNWGNRIAALRWNYLFSNKLFSNTTLTYSKYNFNTHMFYEEYEGKKLQTSDMFDYYSTIRDLTAKVDFDYAPHPSHSIKFGAGFTAHFFEPGVQTMKVTVSNNTDENLETKTPDNDVVANEEYLYVEDDMCVGERLRINLGLHFSGLHVQNTYYPSLQPRASMRFKLMDSWSLKASYANMKQYVHLLSTSTIDLPTDLWVPVTAQLLPPNSNQYAVGTSVRLPYGLDLTLEGFYKTMDNLIAYKDGASFSGTASTNWDDMVEMGEGWAYGAEFMLEKTLGKTTGWLGYTWSKSERQFDEINFGQVFPARYDRRHDISAVLTHKFNDRFDVGVTWVYNTGNAVTLSAYNYPALPSSISEGYYYDSDNIKDYGGRNSYRMPAYHRMDVGFNFHKQKKHGVRTWNLSFYNAYSRQNPFMLMWEKDYNHPVSVPVYDSYGELLYYNTEYKTVLKQRSLFPIIPSLSYTFKF